MEINKQERPSERPEAKSVPATPAQGQNGWWGLNSGEVPASLSHYLFVLRKHIWRVAAFVSVIVLSTIIISSRLTPIYESSATLDIDRRTPADIVGRDALQAIANNDADQFIATQARIIQSDSVLRPVALQYALHERENGFLWRELPAFDPSAPIELKKLEVTRPPNTFLLRISYRSADRELAANVANAVAQSYLRHTFDIRYKAASGMSSFMESQMEELRSKMERSSEALRSYEKDLNILNSEEQTNVLSARILELNTEYTKAQIDRIGKEAAFRSVESGSLDAALVSSQKESLDGLEEDRNETRQKFAELKAHFGPNHPEYKVAQARLQEVEQQFEAVQSSILNRVRIEYQKALDREQMLKLAFSTSKAEADKLNAGSFQYQALKREAEGDKRLYEELLRKIKEETINAGFQNNSARIADPARPGLNPIFPNTPLNAFIALVISSLLALGAAVVSDALDRSVRDPDEITRTMNTQVIGTLPAVKSWRSKPLRVPAELVLKATGANGSTRGGNDLGVSSYIESIRALRNSILLTDFDRSLRSVLLTSASPGEGKSTAAAHLSITHAQHGYRTLLIDADLRRPSIHRFFEMANRSGLSSVLSGEVSWREVIEVVPQADNLHVLSAGPVTKHASELIGGQLSRVLEEVQSSYDLVVLDAPPLLGFAEPLHMATIADGVIIVTAAGTTSRSALYNVVQTLRRLRANVLGVVLNQVNRSTSDQYYYYYGHYNEYYASRKEPTEKSAVGD